MEKSNKKLTNELINCIECYLKHNWFFVDNSSKINYNNLKNMKNGVSKYNIKLFENTYFINYIEIECGNANLEQIIMRKD